MDSRGKAGMLQNDQELDYSNEALRKLGARIRHLRRRRAMTQRDLSFDGCSYSYLARIEAGDRRPSPRVLVEIARRLGVTPEELTGEVSNEQRTRSLEVLDAMMMIRLEQYEEAEELLRGVLREAAVDADAERMSECYEGLALISARRGPTSTSRWPASTSAPATPPARSRS
jgi:transcriptional regulator with XRE-family HTH domain